MRNGALVRFIDRYEEDVLGPNLDITDDSGRAVTLIDTWEHTWEFYVSVIVNAENYAPASGSEYVHVATTVESARANTICLSIWIFIYTIIILIAVAMVRRGGREWFER